MSPMKFAKRILTRLETRGAVPAYAGWVLIGLTLCFWIAAANTMAGWLYVLSGMGVALLTLAATLPMRALKGIEITRSPIYPTHANEALCVDIHLRNLTAQAKGLLIVQDQIPAALGEETQCVIDAIAPHQESAPQQSYTWHYRLVPQRRGLYRWETITLRTGAPLGLFWSRRPRKVHAEALVYPMVLPLARCPIVDEAGPSARQLQLQQTSASQTGQEGLTRSLRPYRWGDPMRLVHWRSSARFNTLRIRELELLNGGQTFVIAIDIHCAWHPDLFEQAVIAAASIYGYPTQHQGAAQLWTAQNGILQGQQSVLEFLAQIEPQPQETAVVPTQPVIWLTANPNSISALPPGSRYMVWAPTAPQEYAGLTINSDLPLQVQLQSPLQGSWG
jgi:uncharacterized protein (DUF58 family)